MRSASEPAGAHPAGAPSLPLHAGAARFTAVARTCHRYFAPFEKLFATGRHFPECSALFTEKALPMKTFTAIVEKDKDTGLYVGYVPGFPGAHSQGDTLDELHQK